MGELVHEVEVEVDDDDEVGGIWELDLWPILFLALSTCYVEHVNSKYSTYGGLESLDIFIRIAPKINLIKIIKDFATLLSPLDGCHLIKENRDYNPK